MSDAPLIPPAGPCPEFRDDLPLLVVDALEGDEAEAVQRHLDTCAACRAVYESHQRVLETVRRESGPGHPLDTRRVLELLRGRLAGETGAADRPQGTPHRRPASGRGELRPEPLMPDERRRRLWFLGLGGVALLVVAGAGLALNWYSNKKLPERSVQVFEPAARLFGPESPAGNPLEGGALCSATGPGLWVQYSSGVEVRLKEGTLVGVLSPAALKVWSGAVAVRVPQDAHGFLVEAAGEPGARPEAGGRAPLGVSARPEAGARFLLTLGEGGPREVELVVAEGVVEWRVGETTRLVTAGQASRLAGGGGSEPPRPVDVRAAFAWVPQQAYLNLKVELKLGAAAGGSATEAALVIRNVGSQPMSVVGYHPLGVNYQLELRRPGEPTPEFVKLAPRTLRRHLATGEVETTAETKGLVRLGPGEAYELYLDLRPYLKGPGAYLLAGHYLGFDPPVPGAGPQGYTLRSEDVKLEAP